MSGVIAVAGYVSTVDWPTDLEAAVRYVAGAVIVAITGWKTPSATDYVLPGKSVGRGKFREDYRTGEVIYRSDSGAPASAAVVVPPVSRDRGLSE